METAGGAPVPVAGRLLAMDGFRGLAIASVVLYHLWPGIVRPLFVTIVPTNGDLGVDLFFFISGFTIFYPYARTIVDGRRYETLDIFFLRRFAKIVPSYVLSIALVLLLGWAVAIPGTSLQTQLLTHALFIHNWTTATSMGINGVLWSLGVEMQFYVFFGLTLRLAMRSPIAYAAGLVAIALAFHLWAALALHVYGGTLLDQLPSNFDFFAAGIACAYVYLRVAARPSAGDRLARNGTLLAIVSCGLLYGWLFVIRSPEPAHGAIGDALAHVVLPLLFFTLAIGTLVATRSWTRVVANPVTLFLMNISYNLYLWHQIVYLAALRRFAGPHPTHLTLAVIALGSLAVSIGIALGVTRYFERPIMKRMRALERQPALTTRLRA